MSLFENIILSSSFHSKHSYLFEAILKEASKKAYIEALDIDENLKEPITKWVDSGAADSYLKRINWNWQRNTSSEDAKKLVSIYDEYQTNGGSRAKRKAARKENAYEVFIQSGLKVMEEGVKNEKADLMLLRSLENDRFIFVAPLSYEACYFMDNAKCGGQKAKWCIGYEKTDEYWRDYTDNGDVFILAFSKNPAPAQNEQKWMIQFKDDTADVWEQTDKPELVVPYSEEQFGTPESDARALIEKYIRPMLHTDLLLNGVKILDNGTKLVFTASSNNIIESMALKSLPNLKTVVLENGIKAIESKAFSRCRQLTSVTIPSSVKFIDEHAFFNCLALSEILYDGTVAEWNTISLDAKSFYHIGATSVKCIDGEVALRVFISHSGILTEYFGASKTAIVPDGITEIASDAFRGLEHLEAVKLPNSIRLIEDSAFEDCENLKSIQIPSGVEIIDNFTFKGCSSLEFVGIPESVECMYSLAFKDCKSLTSIIIPRSMKTIQSSVFYGCFSLQEIRYSGTIAEWNAVWKARDWYRYVPATTVKCTDGEVEIQHTHIDDDTYVRYTGCEKSVKIPEGITRIKSGAFELCKTLKSVTLPNSLTFIGDAAFLGTSLESVIIPPHVESILDGAFAMCKSLRIARIPASVKCLRRVFVDSDNLKTIYYGGTKEQWSSLIERSELEDTSITVHYESY